MSAYYPPRSSSYERTRYERTRYERTRYERTRYERTRYERVTYWETVTPAMVRASILHGDPIRTAGQKIKRAAIRVVRERVYTGPAGDIVEVLS